MKRLQNCFTTPEQSKRLLVLGLPIDSADCYCTWKLDRTIKINVLDNETYSELLEHISQFTVPCWSASRLMEIFDICYSEKNANEKWENHNTLHKGQTYVDYILYVFEHNYMLCKFDFSKLDE